MESPSCQGISISVTTMSGRISPARSERSVRPEISDGCVALPSVGCGVYVMLILGEDGFDYRQNDAGIIDDQYSHYPNSFHSLVVVTVRPRIN